MLNYSYDKDYCNTACVLSIPSKYFIYTKSNASLNVPGAIKLPVFCQKTSLITIFDFSV